jgi:type III secretion system YscQ/HrcQ family protein
VAGLSRPGPAAERRIAGQTAAMTVQPLELGTLPKASGDGLSMTRRAAAFLAGCPREWEATVPPFGRVRIRWLGVGAATSPDDAQVTCVLARDGREGRLVLDALVALQVVAAVLGLPAFRIVRSLGAWERGILAATVAGVLAATRSGVAVRLRSRGSVGSALVRVDIGIDVGGLSTRASIDVPEDWIPRPPPAAIASAAVDEGLVVAMSVTIARTTLDAGDWAAAASGDAVVFDEYPPPMAGGAPYPAEIVCGEYWAAAALRSDGRLEVRRNFTLVGADVPANRSMTRRDSMPTVPDDDLGVSATVLASAPIEVVAEIGRVEIRADELLGLRPGSILALGALGPRSVDLRAGGRLWARGELVNVDGQLGVRLTELVRDAQG